MPDTECLRSPLSFTPRCNSARQRQVQAALFYSLGDRGLEKLSDLPKVTQ